MPDQLQTIAQVLREYQQQHAAVCPCSDADRHCEECPHSSLLTLLAHPVVQEVMDTYAPLVEPPTESYLQRVPRLRDAGHLACVKILDMRHVGLMQWECPRCHRIYNFCEQAYCDYCKE